MLRNVDGNERNNCNDVVNGSDPNDALFDGKGICGPGFRAISNESVSLL